MSRRMRIPKEIYEEFIAADPDTVIRACNIRTFLKLNKIYSITLDKGRRLADADEFMRLYGADKMTQYETVPHIRHIEESVILIKKEFPTVKLTTKKITEIAHGGNVFMLKHGNRWILNYDELSKAVQDYINGGEN